MDVTSTLNAQNHAETMQKLERLNQLETITAEQRIRIEKYRTMYETLKAESEQMENEKLKKKNDLNMMNDEMTVLQEKCQEVVNQIRTERDMKIEECEELRTQILTPQKMEVMKIKMLEEVEQPFKQKLEAMEAEVDKYRNEFNRLRYDYSFLKSEYEHELAQKKTINNELQGKFDIEREGLQKQIRSLKQEIEDKDPVDIHKLRMLQKENTQLNLRVKSLSSELEELRDAKESKNLQQDQASRLQARQLAEYSLQCKSLETERETMKLQLERAQKEVENTVREQDTISNDLHRKERENLQLKSELEEMKHNNKMEMNNIKLNLVKERSELEQERDNLRMELNVLKNKYAINEGNIEQLKKALEEKEHECLKRVQSIKEEDWTQRNKLETSKAQLESQLASLEQQRLDADSYHKTQLDQLQNALRNERGEKEKIGRESMNIKGNLVQEKQKYKALEQDVNSLLEIKEKYQKLLQDFDSIASCEQDMKSDADKMFNTIEMLKKELDVCQEDMKSQRDVHQRNMMESKKAYDEEILKHSSKYTDLQKEHKELKKKHEKLSQTAKKKIKKLKAEVAMLNEDIKMMKSKDDQNAIEKQALLKNLNFEQQRMKRKFDKYRHRQHQFHQVLNTTNFNMELSTTNISPIKRTSSVLIPDDIPTYGVPPKSDVEPLGDFTQDENNPMAF